MISNEIILKKKEIMNENKILNNRIFEDAGVLHGYLRGDGISFRPPYGSTWDDRQVFQRSAELLKFLITVIDIANEDVDKPLIVFNDSINEIEWRDSDYGKVFHVPNSHIISVIFRSEKAMRSLGIDQGGLINFLFPRTERHEFNFDLNTTDYKSVCKAKFIYNDNICIKVDSYEKFCSFISNCLLMMISKYSKSMNEGFIYNINLRSNDELTKSKYINLRSIFVYLTVIDKNIDSSISIAKDKDTIDFFATFIANESNDEEYMDIQSSDIETIILSMLNTITISKVSLDESSKWLLDPVEINWIKSEADILKEDDFA